MTATTNAGVRFNVSVMGEMQLQRALQGRIRKTSNLRPAFKRIAADFERVQGQQFDREGASEGNPRWQPLSALYAAWKAVHFPGAKILTRTRKLRASLTGGAGSVKEIEPLRLVVGGSVRVGRWDLGGLFHTGTKHMPARKPINLARRQRHRFMRFLADHLRLEGRAI